jgi:hypothetical protein
LPRGVPYAYAVTSNVAAVLRHSLLNTRQAAAPCSLRSRTENGAGTLLTDATIREQEETEVAGVGEKPAPGPEPGVPSWHVKGAFALVTGSHLWRFVGPRGVRAETLLRA